MAMLLGLAHKKRHGKDAIAEYLVKTRGFVRISWADNLKLGINAWHGWDERHSNGELKEVIDKYWGYSPRTAYADIGTTLMREQWRQDFWVMSAMLTIKRHLDSGTSVVVADCRFPNEVEYIHEAGGVVYLVHRPSIINTDPHPHISETVLDGYTHFDGVFINDGTLEDLYRKVDETFPVK